MNEEEKSSDDIDWDSIAFFGFRNYFLFVNEDLLDSVPEAREDLNEWLETWGK
jgi:hypothetical protein